MREKKTDLESVILSGAMGANVPKLAAVVAALLRCPEVVIALLLYAVSPKVTSMSMGK
jgi:hypothetical protein